MNEADNRKARAGSIADRGPATISVPAKDLVGEAQAAHRVHARGKLHATRRHLEDLGSACCVEHVRPLEEARERLAVLAVADEAEAGVRRNFGRDAAHTAALAAKRKVLRIGPGCHLLFALTKLNTVSSERRVKRRSEPSKCDGRHIVTVAMRNHGSENSQET